MGRVEEASRLGQQNKFLYPLTFTDESIAVHHVSESLNFSAGWNLAERRPIQNQGVARARLNWRELREVRLARRGRHQYGSEDGDRGHDNYQNQDSQAVSSRNDKFLFLGPAAHAAKLVAQTRSAKEFPTGGLMPAMNDRTKPMSGGHRIPHTVIAAAYESKRPVLPAMCLCSTASAHGKN
jgi:hypothetical protein